MSKCAQKGHIAQVCKSNVDTVEAESDIEEEEEEVFTLFGVNSSNSSNSSNSPRQISVPLIIEGANINMQLDTGCASSLAPQSLYKQHLSHIPSSHPKWSCPHTQVKSFIHLEQLMSR